jgi:hypothetical protein
MWNYFKSSNVSLNHKRYPRIIPQKLKKSKTLKKLNQIKSDNKDLHGSIAVLHQWGFILNVSWEISYTWSWKINLT